MAKTEKHLYEFGPFRIDSVERLLLRGDSTIPLTPKAVDTLLALVVNAGRVVEKNELIKIVWPDTFVEEGALARNISALRKALGDDIDGARYVETIPKRGYRFIASVTEGSAPAVDSATNLLTELDPEPAPEPPREAPVPSESKSVRSGFPKWALWLIPVAVLVMVLVLTYPGLVRRFAPQPANISSIAVLPLNNPSNDQAQEYFADGMTEELINSLAKIEALRVVSRTSAMTYKGVRNKPLPQIARELNVDAIVEGSVLQSGNRIRVTVQLFEGKTERKLWAQSYEQDLRDVLVLQGEMANSIAREIQIKLTPRDQQRLAQTRQVNPDAYLAYSYGRYCWNKRTPDDFRRGLDYFRQAIDKDPTYAPAYAGLADAYALLGSIGADVLPPTEVMPKAKEAALRAVKLDDGLAEGHTSLAYVKLSYDWDLPGAEREFKRAIDLNPGYATAHHWYAHYFLAMGEPDRALAEVRRARQLDPLSFSINIGLGWCLYHARRYDEAIAQYRSTLEIDPNFSLAHCTLGMAYTQKGSYPEAFAEFNKALSLPGSRSLVLANIARTYALSGRPAEARKLLRELKDSAKKHYVPAMYIAAIYGALGEREQSLVWIQRAYDERSDYMVYLKTEPSVDVFRSNPKFEVLLKRIGDEPPR
ncbi:MAG TPA: tetratricopeptide repeat protein [Bryobacteraceae bacterium]|jgi:TolB-like protein/DNA-binding winged helix-turn-helix (wHTH) protein/Tfp pilus assembly protein PilF|nr:tetratricopeptide repeat protein [Bryobacteraceae bacterium]